MGMTREEKEGVLALVTGWSPQLLANQTDEQIDRLYKERVEERDELFYEK